MVSGGFSTIAENVPLESGQNVIEGMGLPDFFEINQSWQHALFSGAGHFPSANAETEFGVPHGLELRHVWVFGLQHDLL